MSDTTERARRFIWKMEKFDGSGDVWLNEYVYAADYDALAAELAAAEKRNEELAFEAKIAANALVSIATLAENGGGISTDSCRVIAERVRAAASEGKP